MGVWSRLAEAMGDDDLDAFAGQQVPNPTEPSSAATGRVPKGARPVNRAIRLYDGTRGMAWCVRPDGMYDVTVYSPGRDYRTNDDRVLHASEFTWE